MTSSYELFSPALYMIIELAWEWVNVVIFVYQSNIQIELQAMVCLEKSTLTILDCTSFSFILFHIELLKILFK